MRIISGKFKGRKILVPKSMVRPTTGKIREAIFNILASKNAIIGTKVLDLFCGSGALGIEALSRGAIDAVFVDKNYSSVRIAQQNLTVLGLDFNVFNSDFQLALKKLQGQAFDLIFLDPPFYDNLEKSCLLLINKYDLLAESGIIVLEHSSINNLSSLTKGFIIDKRVFGNISVLFLTKEERA